MSNLIRCDTCSTELNESYDRHFTLERSGLDVLGFDEVPGPWHFCSWLCMEGFARAMDRKRADGR